MLWCWARMGRIQKLIWTFKIGIKRMSTEIWHVPCHLSLQRSTSIISFVSLQIHIYHQEKWLCGWNSTIQRCSLARRREVCISGSSSATISDHGQPGGNMRLIVTRLLWWWRPTTPQLNCSELPWCSEWAVEAEHCVLGTVTLPSQNIHKPRLGAHVQKPILLLI